MRFKQMGKVGDGMKREYGCNGSASCRDMACAMPACVACAGAEQLNNALRFNFFGFWFARRSIRERCRI